jgi:membrane protease subunit (stomatin/prohibitin family)
VRMRAFGIYSYKIADPKTFYLNISGTREIYTIADLEGQLRNTIVSSITDLFGESGIAFLDMAANQDELGTRLKTKVEPMFQQYGLALDRFQVENVSLPEELQKILDQRIGMGVVGDMGRYTQYQTAQSIPIAAANEGGAAGIGAGIGAGVAIGQNMASGIASATQAAKPAAASAADVPLAIEKLHELLTKGILTQEEFDAKKTELLKKLS